MACETATGPRWPGDDETTEKGQYANLDVHYVVKTLYHNVLVKCYWTVVSDCTLMALEM